MGLYDDLTCTYPLPVPGANALSYQTKDTDAQFLDTYEIREDGTLWHKAYDTEDRSDPNAEGMLRLVGAMTRINQRWEQVMFTGEICFYTMYGNNDSGWLEFSAYFVHGKINQLHVIEHTVPQEPTP